MPQVDFNHRSDQIDALGEDVRLNVSGSGSYGIEVGGTFNGTLLFQGRSGSTWVSLAVSTPDTPGSVVTSTTAPGTWTANIAGLSEVRVVSSIWNSGAAKVDLTSAGVGVAA